MNEKSLDILEQYNLNVHKYFRGRGGIVLYTDQGIKLLSECNKPDKYYLRESFDMENYIASSLEEINDNKIVNYKKYKIIYMNI